MEAVADQGGREGAVKEGGVISGWESIRNTEEKECEQAKVKVKKLI